MKNSNSTHIIHNFFQYSSDLCFSLDKNSHFLKVNPIFNASLGYNTEDIIGKSFFDLIKTDEITNAKQVIDNLRFTQNNKTLTFNMVDRDGNYCKIVWNLFIINNNICGTGKKVKELYEDLIEEKFESKGHKEILELFKISIDNANDAVFWLNKDGGFEYINNIAWKTLGYSKEELLPLSIVDIDLNISHNDFNKKWISYQKYKNKGSYNTKFESKHKRKDGTIFPVEVSITHFWKNDKEYHIAHIRDITERKREEEKLRNSEEKYRQLFENMDSAFSLQKPIYNKEGKAVDYILLEANPVLEKNTGKSAEDIIGKTAKEIFPETEDYWIQLFGEVAKTGIAQKSTEYSKEADRYFDMHAFCPQKGYCASIFNDVTDRVKTVKALGASEEKYRQLFENMTSSFALHKIVYDENNQPIDFIYEEVNPVFEKYTGFKANEVIGKKVTELNIPVEDYWIKFFGEVATSGKPNTIIEYAKGTDKYYEAYAFCTKKGYCAAIFNDVTMRVKNEEALRHSEEKYRSLFTNLPNSFSIYKVIYDKEGKPINYQFTEVNPACEKDLSISAKDLIGKFVTEVFPGTEDYWIHTFGDVIKTGKPFKYSNYSAELDKYYEAIIYPQEKDHCAVIFNDVTERNKNEKALIESEERARLFVENTPFPIALFDKNMNYINASKQWYLTYKLKNQDIIGKNHYQIFPHTPKRWMVLHERVLKGEIIKIEKDKIIWEDGTTLWVRFEIHPWYKNEKDIGGIIVFSEDITTKIETAKALKESEQKTQRVFEVAPIGMGIIKNRTIIEVNPQLCKITGFTVKELIGKVTRILYTDDDEFKRLGDLLYTYNNNQEIQRAKTLWQKKDGTLVNILLATTSIDPKDESKGIIFTAMDITEQKNYETALEKQIVALTRPLENVKSIKFTDLFNIEELQKLQDTFSKATGVASIISHPDGTPITKPSNFSKLCSLIRSTPKGAQICEKSDADLGLFNPKGTKVHLCQSAGLWDASANITLGGVHIANWYIGQVRNEDIDEDKINNLVNELEIDESVLKKHLNDIEIINKEKFETITEAFFLLANEISVKSYQNFQQARFIAEEKEAKQELLRNQKLLEESQRIAKMGSWEIDLETDKLTWNKEAYKVHGYEYLSVEPTYDLFLQQVHPEDKEFMQAHLERSIKERNVQDIKCRIITPDGTLKHVIIAGKIILDDNKPSHLYGIIQDITQQKNNEAQIIKQKEKAKESEERFRALHNASFGGITIHDKGMILDCNRGLSEITGYSYKELIGMDGLLLIAEDYRELVMNKINSGTEEPYEVLGLRKSGEKYPIRLQGKNIPYKGRQVRTVEFRDITKQKQIEEEIVKAKNRAEESEYFLKETQRIGNIGSYKFFHKEGYWISTEIFDEIFGLEPSLKRNDEEWIQRIHPEDRDDIVNDYKNTLFEKKLPFDREYRIIRKHTHETKWIHSYGKAYLDDEGNIVTILGTVQDITERKLVEGHRKRINSILEHKVNERTIQLKQANKDLESFAYSVSHDLRAPIRHIDGFLQLLRKNIEPTEPKTANYLKKIDMATKGMSVMIDELLKFSRLGRADIKLKDVNFNQIIKDIIEQFKPDYEQRIIEWKIGHIKHIRGDQNLLKIVMENIISNAIKYTSKKEIAIIEIREHKSDNNCVTFIVKDNGAGFDMAYKDKLFGVFQRLHKKDDFEGIGIGLANVKQILEKHNGSIDVEATPDKGATFFITLPK